MRQRINDPAVRRDRVLDAAMAVFLRYGYGRTTINDIAAEAAISRPALYLVYANKEEVFAAVVQRGNHKVFAEIRAALPGQPDLEAKLRLACEEWSAKGYDIVSSYPDSRDMFDLSFPAVRAAYEEFQAIIIDILADAVAGSGIGIGAPEMARSLAFALKGFKDTAKDGREMRQLVDIQVSLMVQALSRSSQRS